MKPILKVLCVLLAGTMLVYAGCGDNGDDDPCKDVTCQANASCVQGNCQCNTGYHAEGENCVEDVTDPCDGVDCSADPNSHCDNGNCVCNVGYHDDAGTCVEDETDPCDGVDCSADPNSHCDDGICVCNTGYHDDGGTCVEDVTEECCGNGILVAGVCECDSGYNNDAGDLLCGPDAPAVWPPDLDDIWNGDVDPDLAECIMPACDECGGYIGGLEVTGATWIRQTTTLTTTCDDGLIAFDPRVEVGYVDEQEETLGSDMRGTCAFGEADWEDPPVSYHAGTFYNNTGVSCTVHPEILGASVQLGWAEYDPATNTGVGFSKTYVIGLGIFPDCELTLDVEYWIKP